MTTSGRIVVGVDGSPSSRAALRWALGEARLRGAVVEATMVWRYPMLTYLPGLVAPPAFAREDLEREARAELDEAVDSVLSTPEEPQDGDVRIERVVLEGKPAEELMRLATGADLLVVGHRGHEGFVGLLLGSVAHQCSSHAPCPVVIVRHETEIAEELGEVPPADAGD